MTTYPASPSLRHMGRVPVGTASDRCFDDLHYDVHVARDVDEQAQSISHWSQHYDQLSRGQFSGNLREIWIDGPRIQIFHEHTVQQTIQRCLPWQGSVWFGLPDGRAEMSELRFCGRTQGDAVPPLLSARLGEEFSLRTPQNFGIYGVVVDEDLILDRGGRPGSSRAGLQSTPLEPRMHTAIGETIESMLRLAAAGEAEQTWGRAAISALLDHLLNLLCEAPGGLVPADRLMLVQRRFQTIMAARSIVMQPGHGELTIDELCSRLHLTPRTLQNHFQAVVGQSPSEFLKAMRLNACRRALLQVGEHARIQDVASQWGFFHMGHFSQDYKDMFGELPSHTAKGGPNRRSPQARVLC